MYNFHYDFEHHNHAKSTMVAAVILFILAGLFLLWGEMLSANALYIYIIISSALILVFIKALHSYITTSGSIDTDGVMIRYRHWQKDISIRLEDIGLVEAKGRFFPYLLLQSKEKSIRIYKSLYEYPALLGLLHKHIHFADVKTADIELRLFRLQNPYITLISLSIPVVIMLAVIGKEKGTADFWTIVLLLVFFCIAFGIVAVNIAGSFHRLICNEKGIACRTLFNKWEVKAESIAGISFKQVHRRLLSGYNKEKTLKSKKLPPPIGYGLALVICDKAGVNYIISDMMTHYHLEYILAYIERRYGISVDYCWNSRDSYN